MSWTRGCTVHPCPQLCLVGIAVQPLHMPMSASANAINAQLCLVVVAVQPLHMPTSASANAKNVFAERSRVTESPRAFPYPRK